MEARTAVDPNVLVGGDEPSAEIIRLPLSPQRTSAKRIQELEQALELDLDAARHEERPKLRSVNQLPAGDGAVALPLPRIPVQLPSVAWSDVARRAFDVTAATIALVVLAPLLALIAIAIRLDSPGPALFRQRRLGRSCEPFTIYKFRTMRHGADAAVHEDYMRRQLSEGGHAAVANGKKVFKPWPDYRITRVGELLRRTSLDELPQLFNVLRGEMSLIGFRPPIDYEVECYPDWYYARFAVKPGITGLWQVSGRNERSYEEMIELDIEYAQTRDWKLDLVVLLKTVAVVLGRRGAY